MTSELVAVIDCGTNTTRLLITDGSGVDIRVQKITGLGRGVGASRRLTEDGIKRVSDTLCEFRELIEHHKVQSVSAVGTSAVRDALNQDAFIDAASEALNAKVEIISGEFEAKYSFLGATADLDPSNGPYLVVDIGGGSTEFAYGTNEPLAWRSVDMGAVRYTEQYLGSDPPRPEELGAAIQVARLHLDDIDREQPQIGRASQLIGVAGTVTSIAAVELGLQDYKREMVDKFLLKRSAAEDVFRTLATESLEDRLHNPGLDPKRAGVIVGGCCILVAVMRHWEIDECLVRERDLLDGLADEMLDANQASEDG